jgi:hypothetical protein
VFKDPKHDVDFTPETEKKPQCLYSFAQTLTFLQRLKALGVDDVAFCVAGWQDGGYDGRCPSSFPVSPEAGGEAVAIPPVLLDGAPISSSRIRASLARALVFGGDLFLLDEPFASLDEALCNELCVRLREHFKENGISAILVTHRTQDAQVFADRILQM